MQNRKNQILPLPAYVVCEWPLTEFLGSCSRSLYAVRILKAHGLPISSFYEVSRATVVARLLYAAPVWRGFATAQDCSRIDRFINRTVNLGYLPAHCQTFNFLVNTAEDNLLSSIIRNSYHVLRPLFPPILTRRPSLRKRAHPFTIPLKDDKQCIPRVLYRALLPPVQS